MTALHTEYNFRGKARAENFRLAEFLPAILPTEDDLPCDDGEPMETWRHGEQMNLLTDSLKSYWKKTRRYYVGGNMFLHFRLNARKKFRGPDFFLVTDVDDRERKSWVVWQEGMRYPDLIIELLSDSTRKTDKTEKKELYEQVFRTSEYYIYDPFSFEFTGYRLSGGRYKTVQPDEEKKIYSPVTELWLIVRDERLRWMTVDGYILPSHAELFEMERQRAEEERLRAESEKQRAEEERQQAEMERQRAEEEKQRAEQEKQRAEQEKQRADRLAAKLRELGISPEAI